jgi:hypothetical protein
MSYNLVLDEPVDNDLVEEKNGLKFIINKAMFESSNGFSISSVKRNGLIYYKIMPNVESPSGGGCSSCSSCG